MILLITVFALLITPILAVLLHRWRPKSGLTWLISGMIGLICWLTVLLSRLQLPELMYLGSSVEAVNFPYILGFILDKISWPFALALATCLVALIFTSVIQIPEIRHNPRNWTVWPVALFCGGLGILAIISGNLYTLLLAWAAIDITWLIIKIVGNSPRQGIEFSFLIRAFGLFWAIAAAFSQSSGGSHVFPIINQQTNTLLFIAAFIRLFAILPISTSKLEYPWQGFNRFLDLVLVSSALFIFSRIGNVGISTQISPIFLTLSSIIGLIGGLHYLIKSHSQRSWRSFLIGFSCLSIAGSILSGFEASLAWSISLLLVSSLFFFSTYPSRLVSIVLVLGFVGLTGLPFTPAWQGIRIFPNPGDLFAQGWWWVIFLIVQGLFLGGFLRALQIPKQPFSVTERWSAVVYPTGLILLPVTQFIILIWGLPGLSNDLQAFPQLILTWAPLTAITIAGVFFWFRRPMRKIEYKINSASTKLDILRGLYFSGRGIHLVGSQIARIFDQILQGDAGVLWTVLLLLLLFALLISTINGG